MKEGWKCPECGAVNAPWVQSCQHVSGSGIPAPFYHQAPERMFETTTNPPYDHYWQNPPSTFTLTGSPRIPGMRLGGPQRMVQ